MSRRGLSRSPGGRRWVADAHACPGGCGRAVTNRMFACPDDWLRLPGRIRERVVATGTRSLLDPERTGVIADAVAWYHAHPRPEVTR